MQMAEDLTVCVTGAAGQIAYSFIPQLLKGNVFSKRRICLRLLDITAMIPAMKGIVMQIQDCTYPLLRSVQYGDKAPEMFKDCDVIVMIGGFPRKKGMERKDLLQTNKRIFVEQAKALSAAKNNVKCVVVANPANTNATILSHFSELRKQNITCLTRLDHNRAISQIAEKTGVSSEDVTGVMIFGNHSPTQYPCLYHIKVKGTPIAELVSKEWLEKTFIPKVQKRGGEILSVKGGSSVFSAANAIVDHLRDWCSGTDEIVSMGVVSNGQYGIPAGLWTSLPVRCRDFEYEVVADFALSPFCHSRVADTVQELEGELRDAEIEVRMRPKL